MEFIILNLPTKTSPAPISFTRKFFQTLLEESAPILHNLFQKMEE